MSENHTIPLNLFQFSLDTTVQSRNSEFDYYVFEIESARLFIIENFPKFSESLDNADAKYVMNLWKLCSLYVHGGVFLDNDYRCVDGFKLIELTDKEYFLYVSRIRLSGSILSVLPKNNLISKSIDVYSGSPNIIYKNPKVSALLKLDRESNIIKLRGNIIIIHLSNNSLLEKIPNNTITNNYFNFNYANTFCVSLEKRNDRWEKFINRAKYIGLEVTRWKASTPNDITDAFIDTLTGVEKACAQSHINIWKHIINTGLEYAFILEDDACFDRNMFEKLSDLTKMLETGKKWDAIFLNALGDFHVPIKYYEWTPAIKQYMTAGYIISNNAARFIIDKFKNTKYIAADHMTMALQDKGNCFTYCPWLIIQEDKESDIQSDAHLYNVLKNIKYNLDRANYVFNNTNYVINPPITSAFKLLSDTQLLLNEKNTFCINLMSRPDRWQRFSNRASAIGLNVTRWNAVTCDKITDKFIHDLTPAEKACSQSHINIWKHIIDTELYFAFILEDDACFDRLIFDKLLKLTEQNKKWDAIFLNSLNDNHPSELFKWINARNQSLCGGYILSNHGAKYLLDFYNGGYDRSDKMTIKLQDQGNCFTYFPWIIVQENSESNIQTPQWLNYINKLVTSQLSKAHHEFNNYNYVINTKPSRRLCLITVWFGKLPPYIDIWLHTVKNANYDVLFISDQVIENCPANVRCINTWIGEFNKMINEKTGFNVNINNAAKLVDIKPLYGFLFHDFIHANYEYWGWTDIDMIMGDVVSIIDKSPGYEAYSLGYSTFGPLMIFSINYVDFFRGIERYEDILNDPSICKVDEMWFFERLGACIDQNIYNDENTPVKYYSGKNLKNIFDENPSVHIDRFDLACGFLDWHIKGKLSSDTYLQELKYDFTHNKLFRNDKEIAFCHLTWIKSNTYFCDFIRNNCLGSIDFSFKLSLKFNIKSNISNYNVTQLYSNFSEISELTTLPLNMTTYSDIIMDVNATATVPLNIIQIADDVDIRSNNPEFNYCEFEMNSALSFILENFPDFSNRLEAADESYIQGLWKLCWLYINGGIFLGNEYRCADDFKFLDLTNKEYFLVIGVSRLSGSILSVFPNNKFIKRAIDTYNGRSHIVTNGTPKPTLKINRDKGLVTLRGKVIFNVCNLVDNSICAIDVSRDTSGKIPLNLFQTWHTKDLPPKMKESVELLKSQNPEFTYQLFDQEDCRNFIMVNFERRLLTAYDSLVPLAYKSDLWRYCVLYIRGGIYLDIKYRCINGFKLIELTDKEYFVRDRPEYFVDGKGIQNALISCLPGNKMLYNCIFKILQNIENNYYGPGALYPTGPGLLSHFFPHGKIKDLEYYYNEPEDIPTIINKNKHVLQCYQEYRSEQKSYYNVTYYSSLWDIKEIYKPPPKNIPLNLFQTWYTKDLPPDMRESVELLKSQNPEFNYQLFDDSDCRKFIAGNFDCSILDAFDRLIPGAYKADLWRYCVLYIHGGIYLDIKYQCVDGFKLIELTDKEYFVRDRDVHFPNKRGVYQALLVCHSGNKILYRCIYDIVKNVRNYYYGPSDLYPTGPGLMGSKFSIQEITNFSLNFDRDDNNSFILKNNNIILKSYPSYYSIDRHISYGELWESNNIYLHHCTFKTPAKRAVMSGMERLLCAFQMRKGVKLENGFPKKIHLTCKDKNNITNKIWSSCLKKYRSMYSSNYEIVIHDNNDIYNIVGKHFPEHLDKIKQIKVGAILADIFRYLILYLEGGIYSDMDCEPLMNIDNLYKDERLKDQTKTIVCYEVHKEWHSNSANVSLNSSRCYKNVGICQWFIISKAKQEVFLNSYKYCMAHIDELININPKSSNYFIDVLTLSGPIGFTKQIMDNLSDDICILPSEYFCAGSYGDVPVTKNSYVRHLFTYTWNCKNQ
jgi:mannosyltransferase OCH1-like enzyme/GR25 family glycosyltransferase involved in LPS biosynthesis